MRELREEDSHSNIENSYLCFQKWMELRTSESPYLCDIVGGDGREFRWNTEPYQCAVMNIYSDNGYPLIGTDNKYVQNENHLINSGNIRYYYVEGSNHYTLTDLVRTSPILCELLGGGYRRSGYDSLKLIDEKSLAFFDEFLR